jgi:hypothetical protein
MRGVEFVIWVTVIGVLVAVSLSQLLRRKR